jgi:UDP-glucose 4-epimerase
MQKISILLTGGSGFIGRNIKEQLAEKYVFYTPSHTELDFTNNEKVTNFFSSNKIDIVIHCSNIGGKKSNLYLPDSVEKNLKMFFNIVHNREHFKKMIYLGSGAEYDKSRPICTIKEEKFGERIPKDQYGFYKYICSKYAMHDPKIVALRLFGVFGKYEDYSTRFISNNICRALYGLPISVNQNAYFDFLYINDLVKIIDFFVSNKTEQNIYNVGSGARIDLISLARKIKKITSSSERIIIKKRGYANEYTCDIKKLQKELGKYVFTNIDEALQELYLWFVKNKKQISTQYIPPTDEQYEEAIRKLDEV